MVKLSDIALACVVSALAAVAIVMISEPIVMVGKIEQTFVPVEFPPAIWRGLKD